MNSPSGVTEETAIRQVIEKWSEAMQKKDADGVVSFYAPNPVQFLLAPPLQFAGAKSPAKKGIEEWFSSGRGRSVLKFGI